MTPQKINNLGELLEVIKYIHKRSYQLCQNSFGKDLTNAENIGIFCHYDDEYENLKNLRNEICFPSENPDQKYYELKEPIIISPPEATYRFLYIRKPDPTQYGNYFGDIDFYVQDKEFDELKEKLLKGEVINGARIYDRPDLDMIQLFDNKNDVVAYVSKKNMTEKVRIKQSNLTNL